MTLIRVLNTSNQGARPVGVSPRVIILHADAAGNHESSIAWIMNPVSDVSYHIVIGREGSITQLVPDERRAWHCGISQWSGVGDVNDFSIGVCLSNLNDGKEPYTAPAILAAVDVVAAKMQRWQMPAGAIATHAFIALPAGRKTDPGPMFPLVSFMAAVRQRLACP